MNCQRSEPDVEALTKKSLFFPKLDPAQFAADDKHLSRINHSIARQICLAAANKRAASLLRS